MLDVVKTEWERIGVGSGSVCHGCPAQLKRPLLPWQVGHAFAESERRVVFIGKPHRGECEENEKDGVFMDCSHAASAIYRFKHWPYWSYTVAIADRIHGPGRGWDRVAISNIVKCTNVRAESGKSADKTTPEMIDRCVLQLGVVFAELQALRATHAVFYTHAAPFGAYLEELPFGPTRKDSRKRVACGKRTIPWWEREVDAPWGDLRVLVTGHPQFKKRVDFVGRVSDWVLGENGSTD